MTCQFFLKNKIVVVSLSFLKSLSFTLILKTDKAFNNRTTRQKINKEIEDMNNTVNQLDLTGIYRMLHPTAAKSTSLSSAHGTLQNSSYFRR